MRDCAIPFLIRNGQLALVSPTHREVHKPAARQSIGVVQIAPVKDHGRLELLPPGTDDLPRAL